MAAQKRQAEALAQLFRVLGDRTRVRILQLLQDDEINVTQICKKLRAPQPTVSRHLGILRMADLVSTRRNGKEIYYSLENLRLDKYTRAMQAMLGRSSVLRLGRLVMGISPK